MQGYRDALLDWLACAIGGREERAARAARDAGDGLLGRVAAAATAGHVLDFDDTYLPGLSHLSAPTAPAALIVAAERGANVGDVLDAYTAGFEAMGAMARAGHPALYDGGWHPTAVCGSFGAAVAAARLLGLEARAEGSARALALHRAGGLRSAFGSDGKSIQVGQAAAAGVAAARLAEAGASADPERAAGGPGGYSEAFGHAIAAAPDGKAIEQNWIKAYPCCLQTHGAIEAALAVRTELGPDRTAWPRIEVAVHPVSLQAAPVVDPADGLEAKFSIPYLTAFGLLRGAPRVTDFAAADNEARRLAAERISLRPDPELAESEASIELDGATAARVEAALGSPQRPMNAGELAEKRRELAGEALEGALEDPSRPASELIEIAGL